MIKHKKILFISAGTILFLAVVAVIAFSLILRRTVSYDGEYVAELSGGVTISRDANGVPTIITSGWDDAFFCLGYLHAQDRLLMIEYCRAAARGRLAELIGEDGFLMDKIARVVGFNRSAADIFGALKQPYRGRLEAYVRGINFLKNNKFREIIGLSDVPGDDWTPIEVISILLQGEWGNSYLHNRELALVLPDELKKYPLRDLVPEEYLYWYSPNEQKNIDALREIKKVLTERLLPASRGFAAFIGGSRMADGLPGFIMNLDNPMNLFPLWYPVRFIVDDKKIDGVTSAGLPFIWHGANGNMLFSSFKLAADTQDFCVEETRTFDNRQQYLYQGAWRDFMVVREKIQSARSRRSVVEYDFRVTERGPVLSDVFQGMVKADAISIKHITPDESYIVSLFDLPLAADLDEARMRVTGVNSAPRLLLFASRDSARKVYSGKAPQHAVAGTIFRTDARPVWGAAADISGYARNDEGTILLAGDSIIEDAPPDIAASMFFIDSARAGRIREMLDRKANLGDKQLYEVLFDITSPHARKILPLFMHQLEKMPVTSARLCRIYFNDWDSRMTTDSVPATVFHTLLVQMIRDTMGDELKGEQLKLFLENHYIFADRFAEMFAADKSVLFDDVTTPERNETRDMLFDRAFLRAMRSLNALEGPVMERWRWGTLHKGRFKLPLVKSDSFLARRLYRSEKVMVPGAHSTINMGSFTDEDTFRADMVTSLSAIIRHDGAQISPLFGYSTNPFSDYFDMYVENRMFNSMEGTPSRTVKIEPAR